MKYQFLSLLIIFLFLVEGCSQKLLVRSDPPEAEVYASVVGGKDKIFLGKTPLDLSGIEFKNKTKYDITDGSYVELVVEKKDFITQRLLIPAMRFNTIHTELNLKLRSGVDEARAASKMVEHLRNAQVFVALKDLDRATNEIDQALAYDETFALALSVKGTIAYLRKNYEQSIGFFQKALSYDSGLTEAIEMIEKIKRENQARTPASTERKKTP